MAGKVGFIGLGAMGGPMALNLVKAGFKLVVHDIDQTKTAPLRAKGAELAATAEAVAAEVERTIAKLKGEGLSIVLVEQNIKLTLDIADDVVIMNSGQVAFAGTAAEVRARQDLIELHLGVH